MHFLLPVSAFLLTGMQFARADAVDCVRTITMMTNDGTIYYQTNDSTPFTATFTFDYAACKGIPLTGVTLTDPIESTFSRCTYGGLTELPASGTLITTCATTHGGMAASASPDWEISVKVSSKPSYSATSYFAVVEGDSPVTTTTTTTTSTAVLRASELSARRRRDVQRGLGPTPSTFACPSGYKSCPTLSGQGLDCVDVQRDLNACGGCPGSNAFQDCAGMPGAGWVRCVDGGCVLNSCDRFHTLSSDGTACVPKLRRRQQ